VSLFEGAAQAYHLYRRGIPQDVVECLLSTVSGIDSPVLLDMGTGAGQVPVALGSRMGQMDILDPDPGMLAEVERLLRSLLDPIPVGVHRCVAQDFYAPFPGYTADLVTFSRSFHWMPQAEVLRRLETLTAPAARVAIIGDGSLWTAQSPWTEAAWC
jgi:ubiquinone/menaquinone biosynthesis C-methylase UbiE